MEPNNCLKLQMGIEEKISDTLTVQWNYDDTHLAVGGSDGVVRLFASSTGRVVRNLNCRLGEDFRSISSLKWRPSANTQNVLIVTTCDGIISHWHATSGKLLDSFSVENTQVLCSDMSGLGSRFVLGCSDMSVKVYDEPTRTLINTFSPGRGNRLGHSNRVFCVKWLSENCVVSGGWDNNVIFWDLRAGKSIGGVYGPHVCGESIDFKDDVLYTGSYDIKNQLQAWDTRTFSVINTIEIIEDDISSKVYSLQVQKTGTREKLVVGCKGNSQLLCYSLESFEKLGFVNDSASVYCLDFCHNYNKFAAVTTNHNINIYEMEIIK